MKISIIIPVFNTEKYLNRCLSSIFNQSFNGVIEVITVNDGSSDNSLQLLRDFQINYPDLLIIDQNVNNGLSRARSMGMQVASGDYIMHVDSDDMLLPGALETIYLALCSGNPDVLVFNYKRFSDVGITSGKKIIKYKQICDSKDDVKELFLGACWNKVVRREFTVEMIYSAESIFSTEDLVYCTEVLLRASRFQLCPSFCYAYFENVDSNQVKSSSLKYLQNQKIVLNSLGRLCGEHNVPDKFKGHLLDYFEKWVHLELLKIHLRNDSNKEDCFSVVLSFSEIALLNPARIRSLERSMKIKYLALLRIVVLFGFKKAFILWHRIS